LKTLFTDIDCDIISRVPLRRGKGLSISTGNRLAGYPAF